MAWTTPPSLLGLIVSGDVDGMTIYTSRRLKKVWFPITSPPNAPSPVQQWNRDRFSAAMRQWRLLERQQRTDLATCCDRLNLVCSATSLWVALCTAQTDDLRQTLSRQSKIELPNPRTFPALSVRHS